MLKKFILFLSLFAILYAETGFESVGNKADIAKNLVIEAGKFAKKVGKKKAIAEFSKPNGKFTKGEFYIFAITMNGVTLANYKAKRLIGKNILALKDLNRKPFVKEFAKKAKEGDGWVTYYWKHPLKRKIMKKRSYILRVDKDYFIGCGYYISNKKKKEQYADTRSINIKRKDSSKKSLEDDKKRRKQFLRRDRIKYSIFP